MSKGSKKIGRVLLSIWIVLFCLPIALLVIVRTPWVQQYIAKKASAYYTEKLGTKVEIGRVDIVFPIDISLYDVDIEDKHANNLISAKEITVAPEKLSLNFSKFGIRKVMLREADINIIKYLNEKDLNFQFLVDYFASTDTTKSRKSTMPNINLSSLILSNCNFKWQNQDKDTICDSNISFNNLTLSNINLFAQNVSVSDSVTELDLKHLAVEDCSGFTLRHLSSKITFLKDKIVADKLKLITHNTNLNIDLTFGFDSLSAFNKFEEKVLMDVNFRKSRVGFDDIARFAPAMNGMSSAVYLSGHAIGTVSDFEAEKMKLQIGEKTFMYFDLKTSGLPRTNSTFIDFDLKKSNIFISDIDNFKLPEGKTLNIQAILGDLSRTQLVANVKGYVNDFNANLLAKTNKGNVKAIVKSKGDFPNATYNGKIDVDSFALQQFVGNSVPIGAITSSVNFSGYGTSASNYRLDADAKIFSLYFNNYKYSDITLNGKLKRNLFEGKLFSNDKNIAFNFDGLINFSKKSPTYDFIVNFEELNLSALNFARNNSLANFSGLIDVSLQGNNIDNFLGNMKLSNVYYSEGEKDFNLDYLTVNLVQKDSLNKLINVNSELLEGKIEGQFVFSEISDAFKIYLSNYIPSYSSKISANKKSLKNQVFTYNFTLRDVMPAMRIFVPNLEISENSILNGQFNFYENFMNTQIATNYIKSGKIKTENLMLIAQTFSKNIYLTVQSEDLTYGDSLVIGNLVANTVTFNNKTDFSINWINEKSKKSFFGDITGDLAYLEGNRVVVRFDESDLTLNDSLYHVKDNGKVDIDSTGIRISDFAIYSKMQKITVDGRISKDPYDILQISFENVFLDDFDDITSTFNLDLDGNMNGYCLLSNLYAVPDYRADISIDKVSINKNFIGDAKIKSSWDNNRQAVYSEALIVYKGSIGSNTPFSAKGYFNPRDSVNMLDFVVDLDRLNLKLIQPYIADFSSFIEGSCSGHVNIKGNLDKPDISGNLNLRRTNLKIDYLNMYYSFAHSVKITNNEFAIKDVTVFDSKGNEANGDIIVFHDRFKNMRLDISLKTNRMQFMNTTAKDNDYFYGSAYVSGNIKMSGPFDMISIEAAVKTEPGTVFYLPISSSSEVYESDFISFVKNTDSDSINIQKDLKIRDSGISLAFDIDVTPDAEVQIVFDPKIGDIMKGSGTGRLRMSIDRSGEFLMFGNLEIEKGEYLFTLENIVNKKFLIDKGGIISWNGDPYSGLMDLVARYSVKTSLYELVSIADQSEHYKNKVPVGCLMRLSGNLLSPDITFDIDLPDSDENAKNLVRTIISSSEEMNRQVFSLLILNSFIPTEKNTFNSPISQGIGNTSAELISNQFGNWLSQISKDFDVGFSYNQGDQVSSSQVEIALSTQLLDDRIKIETNLEIGGNEIGNTNATQTSNIAGDVSLEYKITKDGKLRVKAFNRSNTVDIVANNAPYTQGVALFYQKDFDKIKDLWIRKNNKKRKK
ncbi:MAG: translocation/assembly module TamB [Bacteroidales bacterium]|nr:translocation/assembly module TamB [Bacteroidales bacterium]